MELSNAEPAGDGLTRTTPSPAGSALNEKLCGNPAELLRRWQDDDGVLGERGLAGFAVDAVLDFQSLDAARFRVSAEAGVVTGRRQGDQGQVSRPLSQHGRHVFLG